MDAEAAAHFAAGQAAQARGDVRAAAAGFLTAFGMAPAVARHRRAAFEVLRVMDGYRALPDAVLAGLRACAAEGTGDPQPLSLVVKNLFAADPRVAPLRTDDPDRLERALAESAWLLAEPLLLAVLATAVNISPDLEAVCSRLRAHALAAVAQHRPTALLTRFRDFTVAMAMQNAMNRSLWPERAAETAQLAMLADRHDSESILLRAAYRPLAMLSAADAGTLPPPLAALRAAEDRQWALAAAMPRLTPLAPGLSEAMQAQYETYPYPRWRVFEAPDPAPLRDVLARAVGPARVAAVPDAADVLVAGCGTGHPALSLAAAAPAANITAIDLSRVSLAYAQDRAAALGIGNIRFAVADILSLGTHPARYHFIECGGVLHHMAEPAAGLRVLAKLLRPDGLMLVSLYSRRGRSAEIAAQDFVRSRGFAGTIDGLRAAREAIMALPQDHPARGIVGTADFFTADGLHDLIFNVHECQFTPATMKQLLAACGLRAIAVDAPDSLGGAAFRRAHPDPGAGADLDLWEAFEEEHPQVFAHMIKVWCVAAA